MFEDSNFQNGKEVDDITNAILNRYRKKKTYFSILKRTTLSKDLKSKLRDPHTKQLLLQEIEKNITDPVRSEGTYEIWNKENFIGRRANSLAPSTVKYDEESLTKLLEKEQDNDVDIDDSRFVGAHQMKYKVDRFYQKIQTLGPDPRMQTTVQYLSQIKGYEILPYKKKGFHQYHIDNLTFLLHRHVMAGNWDLSYKIFSILIRIKGSELRSLWPLGVEILRGKQKGKGGDRSKEQQFLSWLVSYYIIGSTRVSYKEHDPVYKYGTEGHVPFYVVELYWSLFEDQKFEQVRAGLSSLIIKDPYSKSGVLSFMLSLCYLFENIQLADKYAEAGSGMDVEDERVAIKSDIKSNFGQMEENLRACDAREFVYSRGVIDEQIKRVRERINEVDDEVQDSIDRRGVGGVGGEVSGEVSGDFSDFDSDDETGNLIKSRSNERAGESMVEFSDGPESEIQGPGRTGETDRIAENTENTENSEHDTGWLSNQESSKDDEDEEEIPDPYDDEEIPDPYRDEEGVDQKTGDGDLTGVNVEAELEEELEEIPDAYEDDEEEIPDAYYEDEEEIPDPYDEDEGKIEEIIDNDNKKDQTPSDEDEFYDANERPDFESNEDTRNDSRDNYEKMDFDFEFF